MISTLVIPESMGFVRVITNLAVKGMYLNVQTDDSQDMHRFRAYAYSVLKGTSKKPYCPIVQMLEEQNEYRVRFFPSAPVVIHFESVLDILEAKFRELSPRSTVAGQPIDLTTVVAAFGHPLAMNESFCRDLKVMHEAHRFRFIEQGLMVAYMHPLHPLGSSSMKREEPGSEPLYLSAIPLIIVRRMIPADDRFMRLPHEREAYQRFFSPAAKQTAWSVGE